MSKRRAVITGIGVVSPLKDFWKDLLDGKSGVRKITKFDPSSFPSQIAAEIDPEFFEAELNEKEIKRLSINAQYALVAARRAIADSYINKIPRRSSVVVGSGLEGWDATDKGMVNALPVFKYQRVDPSIMLKAFIATPTAIICLKTGIDRDPCTETAACASASVALQRSAERIKSGHSKVVLCGSVDAPITPTIQKAFCASGQLSTSKENPGSAIRPFDKNRTKHCLGEGSAFFLVEDYEYARKRGARIYCEIGNGSTATESVNEMFMLEGSGRTVARIVRQILWGKRDKKLIIDACAPGNLKVDAMEMLGIKNARVAKCPVFSIKGSIGQGISSANAFQIAAGAYSLYYGVIPPTRNLFEVDANLPGYSYGISGQHDFDTVLINARGYGGFESSVLLHKVLS